MTDVFDTSAAKSEPKPGDAEQRSSAQQFQALPVNNVNIFVQRDDLKEALPRSPAVPSAGIKESANGELKRSPFELVPRLIPLVIVLAIVLMLCVNVWIFWIHIPPLPRPSDALILGLAGIDMSPILVYLGAKVLAKN
jgi:hypothetical protein